MIDKTHPYFGDPEFIRQELAKKHEQRPAWLKPPHGSFETIHRGNGEAGLQGYVWTNSWVVGVWVTFDGPRQTGKNVSTVFWTVVENDVQVAEFKNTGWTETEIVAQAARWFDQDHEL